MSSDDEQLEFRIMVDPKGDQFFLMCPSPLVSFTNITEYKEFITGLEAWIPHLVEFDDNFSDLNNHNEHVQQFASGWEQLMADAESDES